MTLITRQQAGRRLTIQEMDGNLRYLDKQKEFITDENLSVGEAVSLLSSGNVTRSENVYNGVTITTDEIIQQKVIKISENRSLYYYLLGDGSVRCKISENTGDTITLGSEIIVAASGLNIISDIDCVLIGTEKVAFCYIRNATPYDPFKPICFIIGEITGTNINFGTEFSISSSLPSLNSGQRVKFSLTSNYPDRIFLIYQTETQQILGQRIFIVGLNIAPSPLVPQVSISSVITSQIKAVILDSDRVAISYLVQPTASAAIVVLILKGLFNGSFSLNSTFCAGVSLGINELLLLSTDKVLLSYRNENKELRQEIYQISDITPTRTNLYTPEYLNQIEEIKTSLISSNKVAYLLRFNNNKSVVQVFDFNSDPPASFAESTIFLNLQEKIAICEVANGRVNVSQSVILDPNNILSVISGSFINNVFNSSSIKFSLDRFVGISQTAASTGQSVRVKMAGSIDETQAGLIPGEYYQLLDDGSLVSTFSAGKTDSTIGRALSSTELLILP